MDICCLSAYLMMCVSWNVKSPQKAIKTTISWTWYLILCKSLLYHHGIHLEMKLCSHPKDEVFLMCFLCCVLNDGCEKLTQLSLSWLMFKKWYHLFSLHIFTIDNKIYFVTYYTPQNKCYGDIVCQYPFSVFIYTLQLLSISTL